MKLLMISAAALTLLGAATAASANPVEGAAIGAGSGLLIAGPPGAVDKGPKEERGWRVATSTVTPSLFNRLSFSLSVPRKE